MSLINRPLNLSEKETLVNFSLNQKALSKQKIPFYVYGMPLGVFLSVLGIYNFTNGLELLFLSILLTFGALIYAINKTVSIHSKIQDAKATISEINQILKENDIQLKQIEFTKGIKLCIEESYVFYLMETKDKEVFTIKYFMPDEEPTPYSKIEFYQNDQIQKYLGNTLKTYENLPILQELYCPYYKLYKSLKLEDQQIIPKKLDDFLKDYEVAVEIEKIKEKEENERWEKMSVEEAQAEIRKIMKETTDILINAGKKPETLL